MNETKNKDKTTGASSEGRRTTGEGCFSQVISRTFSDVLILYLGTGVAAKKQMEMEITEASLEHGHCERKPGGSTI